jgi:hypothetical protein
MKITREAFKNIVREVMTEESEYQTFFKKALEKTGKSIPDMSDEEKKAFFNKIDSAWQGKGEKNEELVGNQKKLDVDGDGEIEASDLAALRAGKKVDEATNLKTIAMLLQNKGIRDAVRKDHADKLRKIIEDGGVSTKGVSDSELIKVVKQLTSESVNEATLEKGTKLRYEKNTFVVDYVVDKKYTGRDGFPKYILKVVKSNTKNIKVGSTIEYDDARLTGLIRNRVMTFVKNESVNEETLKQGTKLRYDKNTFVVDYVVDKKYTGRDGFPKYILKVVKSNYPNKIKVGSTEEYDDSRLTGLIRNKVMTFVKNESVNEEILKPGTKVKVQHKGKTVSGKIVRYDSKTPGSPFYVVYTGQYDSIEVPAYQVKKESVVKEGKLSDTWRKNNKKGYILKVGNIELKSAGPTNTHDILVNRQPWGTFHMDYESGGTDFWVKPLRGNDFWVKEIDDIVKKVKADPRFKESVSEAISYKDGKYHFYEKNGVGYLTYDGKVLSHGDYDIEDGSNSYWMSHSSWGGQKAFDTGKDVIAYFKKNKIVKESINEAGGTVRNPKTGKDVKISTALSYGKSHPAYQAAKQASGAAKKPLGPPPGVKAKPPVNAKPAMGTKVTSPAPTNAKPAMGTKVTSAPPKNAQPPVGTKVTGPPPGVRPKPPVVAPPSAKPAGTPPGVKAKPPVIAPPSAAKKPLGPPPGVKPKGSVPPPPPPPPPPSGKPSVGTPPGVKAKPPVIAPPSAAKAPLGPPPGVRPKGAVPPPPPPPPPKVST